MTEWGHITVETHQTPSMAKASVRITQADKHCLIHPSLLAAAQQREYPWITADGFQTLTLDDGETRVVYRIGGMVMDGWNSGYRLDRIDAEETA